MICKTYFFENTIKLRFSTARGLQTPTQNTIFLLEDAVLLQNATDVHHETRTLVAVRKARLGDNFGQRAVVAIEVDERVARLRVATRRRGVVLEVHLANRRAAKTLDVATAVTHEISRAFACDRCSALCDLVARLSSLY